MPKYDAFGREIGEDTLSGLGDTSESPPRAEPVEPVESARAEPAEWEAAAAPAEPDPREAAASRAEPSPRAERVGFTRGPATITLPLRPQRPPRRRGRRVLAFVILALVVFFVLPLLLAGFAIVNTVEDATRGLDEILTPEEQRPAPAGLGAGSLVRADRFGAAMRRLQAQRYGALTSLRVAPDRIDAQFRTGDGRLMSVQLRSDGRVQSFGKSGPGFGFVGTIPFSKVRPGVPERLTRSAAERVAQSPAQLNYLALSRGGPRDLLWGVFFKDGAHVQGFGNGRVWRRVS